MADATPTVANDYPSHAEAIFTSVNFNLNDAVLNLRRPAYVTIAAVGGITTPVVKLRWDGFGDSVTLATDSSPATGSNIVQIVDGSGNPMLVPPGGVVIQGASGTAAVRITGAYVS